MTHFDAGRAAILDVGSEDYYDLANAAMYLPTVPPDERASVARQAMRQLVYEGLVQLFFGDFATNAMAIRPQSEALRAIDDPGPGCGDVPSEQLLLRKHGCGRCTVPRRG